MNKMISLFLAFALLFAPAAFADPQVYGGSTNYGNAKAINFSTGFTVTKANGVHTVVVSGSQAISGGTIDGAIIGGTTPAAATVTTLVAGTSIEDDGLTASRVVATDGSKVLASTFASAALSGSLSDETGSGVAVFATSPTLVTPVLGAATGTSLNLSGGLSAATMNYCTDAGSTDTYACNVSPAPAAYTTGMTIRFKANTANTGAASINLNSLGALPLKRAVSTDPADNFIKAGSMVECLYDGTNCQMLQPAAQ